MKRIMKIEGYKIFEIPKSLNSIITIKYGDYITIHCEPEFVEELPSV